MIYAFNDIVERKSLWSILCTLSDSINIPWILCGDFNCVLSPTERLGGMTTMEEMEDFQSCVDYCHLMDSPATGSFHTWNNKQELSTRVYSRLDRVLVNQKWLVDRVDSYAHFHDEGYFDHSPCIIQDSQHAFVARKSFKYFSMWSQVDEFLPCVQHHWSTHLQGTKMYVLVKKLKSVKQPLKQLNSQLFTDIENNAAHAWKVMDAIQSDLKLNPLDATLIEQERTATKTYRDLQAACDSFLLFADVDGNIHTEGDQIQNAFLNYYTQLLGTSTVTSSVCTSVVQQGKVCTLDHWNILLQPVTPKEVKHAIFSIPWHKAPGPDGFSSSFYKDAWVIVGDEVNHTFISLLPKCELPLNVTHFRPISFCNVIYKAISKILCTRLATILPDIISINQGGFIQKRNIIENILICQDIVRLYNRKTVSPRCLMKIDLKKAYDSVNWDFIEQMLNALNFPPRFINLVMVCVRTASYSLVLNGVNFGYFKGAKGLRKGDPISPLLFTITMEYLTRVLSHVTSILPFRYHPLCGHLKLSHMMFADDLLMFSKTTGLQMNSMKSNIYFNGVHQSVRADILQVSGFTEGTLPFKYLGVPITSGRLSVNHCSVLIDFATTFVLPKGVLRRIDAMSRNYLWDGNTEYIRSPMVSWEKVCTPRVEGGLGIRDSITWNYAAIGKLWSAAPAGYSISSGYHWLRLKYPPDDLCLLCGAAVETHAHLFQQCHYTCLLLQNLKTKLNLTLPTANLLVWIYRKPWSSVKKKVALAWYYILKAKKQCVRGGSTLFANLRSKSVPGNFGCICNISQYRS
ncbi:uncharacterized protein LOC141628890 [Silene latifolia]|uniref:uncharacterized protein LOC141628890 n=1 Tax=Silene latifolia TaxID=37657 RepID=UPI003D77BB62